MPRQIDALAVKPHERKAVALATACGFVLLGSYYILRPLRDTVATVLGVDQLQRLFTATFVGTRNRFRRSTRHWRRASG